MSRHQPVCEMPGLLSRFYLFIYLFIYYYFYFFTQTSYCNLENENELLALMDIDHPVRNSTNNTVIGSEVSEEISD